MRVDKHKNKKFIRGFIFGFILAVIIVVAIFFVINKLTSIQKSIIVKNVTVDNTKCCLIAKGICQVIVEPTQCTTGIIVNCSSIICNPMLA
jgi:uncharacterized membrane protein required for colicin V production